MIDTKNSSTAYVAIYEFIVVLHTIVFSDLYCVAMCELNRFIVDLSETPRYFGPWYRDTPT